jgi:hypothetical protein
MTKKRIREKPRGPGRISARLAPALRAAPLFAAFICAGCSRSPSYDLMGSLFPAWLICMVVGVLLTLLTRWALMRKQFALSYPALAYPCLAAAFTFLVWLIFY